MFCGRVKEGFAGTGLSCNRRKVRVEKPKPAYLVTKAKSSVSQWKIWNGMKGSDEREVGE